MSVVLCEFSGAVLDTPIFLSFAFTLNHHQKTPQIALFFVRKNKVEYCIFEFDTYDMF